MAILKGQENNSFVKGGVENMLNNLSELGLTSQRRILNYIGIYCAMCYARLLTSRMYYN